MEKIGDLRHLFVTVFLSFFATVVVFPGITDVTIAAVCPGAKDQCSLAIYLTGFQQAITGVGTVIMMPLLGNLSDVYGRKALLTLPLTLHIFPPVILAYRRTTNFFYAYYALRTLTDMISVGSVLSLSLAYVADNISASRRASAFGIVSGVGAAASFGGNLVARFISTAQTFQVSTIVSMIAVIYMRVFLEDTKYAYENLKQPILKTDGDEEETTQRQPEGELCSEVEVFKKIPSLKDLVRLLNSSKTFSVAAFISFFRGLADGGLDSCALYFYKARFQYSKDQFADLLLILGISGTISQLIFMPFLVPVVGEEKLLSVGLFVAFFCVVMNSISWSSWVPYAIAVLTIFTGFSTPCLRSIVSKQVGPNEQGISQGCIAGIGSFSNIAAPFIFSPLTDLFLSNKAPFYFPGFSIMCMGVALMIAFIASVMIGTVSPASSHEVSCEDCLEA